MQQEYPMIPLFEQFVTETYRGKRLKKNGDKIKKRTAYNYAIVLKILKEFQEKKGFALRVRLISKGTFRQFRAERNYWKRFYFQFSQFLYTDKHCFDNYVGGMMKAIRTFLIYLEKEKLLMVGDFYKLLYIKREEVDIITLLPERLRFLIQNKEFDESLPLFLKRCKDFFVFGCTVGLRISDLSNIQVRDIEEVNNTHYLFVRSLKTETVSRIKLPTYAVEILERYGLNKKKPDAPIRYGMPAAI